jgi:malate synthase
MSIYAHSPTISAPGIEITAPVTGAHAEILTPEAMLFLASLADYFEARRQDLLARRRARQAEVDRGKFPDLLSVPLKSASGNGLSPFRRSWEDLRADDDEQGIPRVP